MILSCIALWSHVWHFDCHCLALKADSQRAGVFNFESEDTILITCQSKGNHALNYLFFPSSFFNWTEKSVFA